MGSKRIKLSDVFIGASAWLLYGDTMSLEAWTGNRQTLKHIICYSFRKVPISDRVSSLDVGWYILSIFNKRRILDRWVLMILHQLTLHKGSDMDMQGYFPHMGDRKP
jgi:hypothetical protein